MTERLVTIQSIDLRTMTIVLNGAGHMSGVWDMGKHILIGEPEFRHRAESLQDIGDRCGVKPTEVIADALELMATRAAILGTLEHVFSADEWHEDIGPALWWTKPVSEPPFCGTPLDEDWPGYHQWWTRLPLAPESLR